jgi:hypothetical protein
VVPTGSARCSSLSGGDAVQEGRPSARRDGEYGTVGVLGVTDPELDRRAADAAPDSAVVQFGNWRLSRDPGNT